MIGRVVEDLDRLVFYLNSHNFTYASKFSSRALELIKSIPKIDKPSQDYSRVFNSLIENIDSLKKCISTSKPGHTRACISEARRVYRYSLLLKLIATGEIRELVKARRYAYTAIALGLPTSALFGLSPLAIGLIFISVLWTYFYFIRLKMIGWVVLVSALMLILPFLVNSVLYFTSAVSTPIEVENVARALELSILHTYMVLLILFAISSISLILDFMALVKLLKYRVVFE